MKLEVIDLHVSVEGKEILKGVSLKIEEGEVHALMGPNGSGKSTLAYAIMGHPKYKVTKGDIRLNGQSIVKLSTDKRAKLGLFLAFQYPITIQGVSLFSLLKASYGAVKGDKQLPILKFRKLINERLKFLGMDSSFAARYVNEGFSGGEKKKSEILQLSILKPKFALLDEPDSGLDVDSLKVVAEGINSLISPDIGILIITHYQRILKYVKPQFVHIMIDGVIKESNGYSLAEIVEQKGYGWLKGE